MVTHRRRGSVLVLTLIILLVVWTLGSALLSLTSGGLLRSRSDMLRAQALDAAEAGVEKAIYYLRNTAPDGTTNGSWRTASRTENVTTAGGQAAGSYTFSVANGTGDDAEKIVILCSGQATLGSRTASRRLRVVISRVEENVSPWNNVIFAGAGQTGKSINGNVVMRGSVHLLGEGEPFTDVDGDQRRDVEEPYVDSNGNSQFDTWETYTDTDGDGHRDAQEAYTDVNGSGSYDPPLTATDFGSEEGGNTNFGNNYSGMPSELRSTIPSCPTRTFGGETVETLSAKLRVKHGRLDLSGSATVGDPNASGGSPPVKETIDGSFVSDGFGGSGGTNSVYSDNGTTKGYDLQNLVQFPDLVTPIVVDGVNYSGQMEYLEDIGLEINGTITLQPDQSYSVSDAYGNSLSVDGAGRMTINGIVHVNGDLNLNRGSESGSDTFRYSGRGTLAASGSIKVHTNLLPVSTFPTTDALGMVARHRLELATGEGDSQLKMVGAFYAQEQVVSQKQNEIAGTFVASHYSMQNVPKIYQVPALAANLPPGMPGSTPIWIITTQVHSWREIAPV